MPFPDFVENYKYYIQQQYIPCFSLAIYDVFMQVRHNLIADHDVMHKEFTRIEKIIKNKKNFPHTIATCDRNKDISIDNLEIVFRLLMHELKHPYSISRVEFVDNILSDIYTHKLKWDELYDIIFFSSQDSLFIIDECVYTRVVILHPLKDSFLDSYPRIPNFYDSH